MTPLFSAVDHRIDSSPLPFEERRVVRRTAPERLRFDLPPPGQTLPQAVSHAPEPMRSAQLGRFARFAAILRLWAPA